MGSILGCPTYLPVPKFSTFKQGLYTRTLRQSYNFTRQPDDVSALIRHTCADVRVSHAILQDAIEYCRTLQNAVPRTGWNDEQIELH